MNPAGASSRSGRLVVWALALVTLAVAPTVVVKRLDGDNRFCIACHLHGQIFRDMTELPRKTLASAHFRARHGGHPERCFTCHSGEGVVGWTQVTLLSAWDAARWVAGDRHEPTSMRLPLTNSACLKCHQKDVYGTMSSEETDRYHELSDHRGIQLACFACHAVHHDGPSDQHFLDHATVRAQCRRCHRGLDGGGPSG